MMNFSRINWSRCRYKAILLSLTSNSGHQSQLICRLCHTVHQHRNFAGLLFGPHRRRYLNYELHNVVTSRLSGRSLNSSGPPKVASYQDETRRLSTIPSQKVEEDWTNQASKESPDRTGSQTTTANSQRISPEENGTVRNNESTDVETVRLSQESKEGGGKISRTEGINSRNADRSEGHNSGQSAPDAGHSSRTKSDEQPLSIIRDERTELLQNKQQTSKSGMKVAKSVKGNSSENAADTSPGRGSAILMKESRYALANEGRGQAPSKNFNLGVEKATKGGKTGDRTELTSKEVEAKSKQKKRLSDSHENPKLHLEGKSEQSLPEGTARQEGIKAATPTGKSAKAKSSNSGNKKTGRMEAEDTAESKSGGASGKVAKKRGSQKSRRKVSSEQEGKKPSGKDPDTSLKEMKVSKSTIGKEKKRKRAKEEKKLSGEVLAGQGSTQKPGQGPKVSMPGKVHERSLVLLEPEIPPSRLLSEEGSRLLVFLRKMYLSHSRMPRSGPVDKGAELPKLTPNVGKPISAQNAVKANKTVVQSASESLSRESLEWHRTETSVTPGESSDLGPRLAASVGESVDGLGVMSSETDVPPGMEAQLSTPKDLGEDGEIQTATSGTKNKARNKGKMKKASRLKNPDDYIIPVLDTYAYTNKMDLAQSLFDTSMMQGPFRDRRVYNLLLGGWAKKGNMKNIKKIFSVMSKSEVQPDAESFASVLECIGRMEPLDRRLATQCISDLEKGGMTLDDLVTSTTFTQDSRDVVLKVIRAVKPEFVLQPLSERPSCTLKVVKELYRDRTRPEGAMEPLANLFNNDTLKQKMDLQWKTEEKESVNIKSVEEEVNPTDQVLDKRKALAEHKGMWWRALKKGLALQKRKQSRKNFHSSEHVYPFMTILSDDDYVQLMMESLPKFASTSEGIGTLNLARELGSRVNQRYIVRKKRKNLVADKTKKLYLEYTQRLTDGGQQSHATHRELWQRLLDENPDGPSLDFETSVWPSSIVLKIGNFMADVMLREIQIDAHSKSEKKFIPGLYHMYSYRSMKQIGFIKPHPLLIDLFQGAKDPDLPFDSNILPMVTPPLPWMSTRFGGYPLSATRLMRCKEGSLQAKLISDKADNPELQPVLDSLNQLSTVPWIINKKMLDIIIDVFRKEGSKELDIPQPASVFPPPPPIKSDATPEEISQIHQERANMRKTQAEMHSLRMDMLYKLSIANHFRDEIFWFPHNMDFRGRVYPCPPHFNHLGSDVTRSLLLFAQGRPLGEKGLDWLKIHLINLSGLKKRFSLDDRLAYADKILPDILDSAEKPFDGKKWWQSADEPWQALACCMEIAEALRVPDPSKFISHLPIHQDGSCNGLQHYAALGRDVIGAQQVNLHPFPVPQDVYSGVAQMVEELRQADAENGLKVAEALAGSVQRKVVKQTVMTVVYGVTIYGGRHQIYRQLKDMEVMSDDDAWYAANYLVLKVFQSLGKMFAKTREIQDWLTESALMIAMGGSSVEWVTPLGLPIVQPYHKKSQVWVSTTEKWSLYHNDTTNCNARPDARKQKNAFPPNFIHSLDSSHMMLTSLHCQRAGVTFASVHDCFWTHACTVDIMNKICREQFVKLHEQPILHDLARYLVERFGNIEINHNARMKDANPMEMNYIKDYLRKVPETGDFDLQNVLKSTYFFS